MADTKKDFQESLHEVLKSRLHSKSNQEKLLQTILDKSDKSPTNDFQEVLRKSIKPLSEDKTKKDLEPKIKKVEAHTKEIDISQQVKSGADVDKIFNDVEEKDEDISKGSNSNNELTRKEEMLKQMYSTALDEYYKLREDLYKYQIQEGNIAVDDRNYLKLLQYENYLRKCDTLFKSTTGSYVSGQDENISKKENKYAYGVAKSELNVLNQHQKSINEIYRLNNEIEDKANEIMIINEEAKSGNVQNYEKKIELLESDYIALNAKMHMLKPNILELYRQEEEKEQQEKDTTRIVGTMYEKRKDKLVIDSDVVRLDKKIDKRDDFLEDAAQKEKNELQNTNINLANSYIDAAETALDKNDADEALFMVGKAKELVGKEQVGIITNEKSLDFTEILKNSVSSGDSGELENNVITKSADIDNYLNDVSNNKVELSDVQKECTKAVFPLKKRDENVLAREAKEKSELEKVKIKDIAISR